MIPNTDSYVRLFDVLGERAAFEITANMSIRWGNDYEIAINTDPLWSTLSAASLTASEAPAAFNFLWLL